MKKVLASSQRRDAQQFAPVALGFRSSFCWLGSGLASRARRTTPAATNKAPVTIDPDVFRSGPPGALQNGKSPDAFVTDRSYRQRHRFPRCKPDDPRDFSGRRTGRGPQGEAGRRRREGADFAGHFQPRFVGGVLRLSESEGGRGSLPQSARSLPDVGEATARSRLRIWKPRRTRKTRPKLMWRPPTTTCASSVVIGAPAR